MRLVDIRETKDGKVKEIKFIDENGSRFSIRPDIEGGFCVNKNGDSSSRIIVNPAFSNEIVVS